MCLHVCLSERVHLNFPSITSYYPGDKSAGLTEPPPIGSAPGSKCPPQHQPVGLHWDIKRKVCVILFIQKSLKRHREVEGDLLWMVRLVKRGLRMRCLWQIVSPFTSFCIISEIMIQNAIKGRGSWFSAYFLLSSSSKKRLPNVSLNMSKLLVPTEIVNLKRQVTNV